METILTRHNLHANLDQIKNILLKAHHISIDTEFTGLGDSKKTKSQNIEDRYRALAQVVMSHALLALGLVVFEKTEIPNTIKSHAFHFVLLSNNEFLLSPRSCSFLVDNGFDFNYQFRNGIPYTPGDVLEQEQLDPLRCLFRFLLSLKVPIVVHNGLLDLMFLYHSFYSTLPMELPVFVADLSDMFKGGLYDTKYIADFISREKTSFLAYLFRKCQRMYQHQEDSSQEVLECVIQSPLVLLEGSKEPFGDKKLKKRALESGKPYCEQYAAHGYCNFGKECTKSHDLDLILDYELPLSKKVKLNSSASHTKDHSSSHTHTIEKNSNSQTNQVHGDHSACYDAYMTGYVFASQIIHSQGKSHQNRLYLMGKDRPLIIEKSNFSKYSKAHLKTQEFILFEEQQISKLLNTKTK